MSSASDANVPATARRWKIFLLIAMFTIVADQASKLWARHSLPTHPGACEIPDDIVARKCVGTAVSFIDGVWEWRLSFNPGSAFGLFHGQTGARVFLSVIGLVAVGAMGWMVHRARDHQRALLWALGLVAGGAVGNLMDRMYFGVVTDFVLWRYKTTEWPVFNVADVALVVGVILMFFDVGREPKAAKAKAAQPLAAADS